MDDSTRWKAVPQLDLSTHVFNDQIAVYDDYTGSTFLLDEITVAILMSLVDESQTLAGVMDALAKKFSLATGDTDVLFVTRALDNLQRSALVEQVRN